MKTAISIPDEVFKEAERHARHAKKSRSQLYSEAIAEYLDRHASDAVTEAMNKACANVGDEVDPFVKSAARRTLKQSSW